MIEIARSRARFVPKTPLALALATLLACPVDGNAYSRPGTIAPQARLQLDLAFFDGAELPETTRQFIYSEVEEIFAQYRVRIGWVDRLANPQQPVRAHEMKVVLLATPPGNMGFEERILGAALGETPLAVFVFHPSVLQTVERYRALKQEEERDTQLGDKSRDVARAVARVIAHELIHTLTPGMPHAESGLMSLRLDKEELLGDEVELDPLFSKMFYEQLEVANKKIIAGLGGEGVSGW